MTHIDPALIEAALPYFETRAKVAALLKQAGVKKHAREYVAEVLLDAGVIDLDELESLTQGEEEQEPTVTDLEAEWVNKEAWWNQAQGTVMAVEAGIDGATGAYWRGIHGRRTWIPVKWLSHERPIQH